MRGKAEFFYPMCNVGVNKNFDTAWQMIAEAKRKIEKAFIEKWATLCAE